MQLDRTEIVIRARSALELLDLSLLVLKKHFLTIAVTSAIVGVPLLVLDVLSTAWMLSEDNLLVVEHLEFPLSLMRWRHSSHLFLLYVLQFQLISLPTSVYLGNQIFYEPLPLKRLLSRLWPIAWRALLVLGVLRLGLVGLVMEFFVNRASAFDTSVELWMFIGVVPVALIFRSAWPFAPEIIGLELCPLRIGKKKAAAGAGTITYAARSRGLHRLLMSDHLARFIGASFFAFLLFLTLITAQLFVKGAVTGDWQWNFWFDHCCLPLTMWVVGLFMAVFRFLSYLDSRIRLEGWEIELRMKAEAARLTQPAKITAGSLVDIAADSTPADPAVSPPATNAAAL